MNRIKTLNINNFRHLKNLNGIQIGEKLTIIAGENGTGKSSLLGLIGHIFSFHDSRGKIVRTIDNKRFETQFSEVFRFSRKYDYHNIPYSYSLEFNDRTIKEAESRYIEGEDRFRIDVGSRQTAAGKVNLPVIYLGLKRLIPLAQESDSSIHTIQDNKLDDEEKQLYQEWHNRVLVISDNVIPQHTKSLNKELYYAVCDKYDAFGNSAGQDNLAQIILALLSFKRLRKEMGNDYPGGLLLIDEADATLYPAAQHQLVKLLLDCSGDYDIQVVFTTHSTDIISYMLNPDDKTFYYASDIVYLRNPKGTIEVVQDKNKIEGILAELQHKVIKNPKRKKISVYLEDEEARLFFKGLLTKQIRTQLEIKNFNHGANVYIGLLEEKFPEFRKTLIILDGDQSKDKNLKLLRNVLFLPGSTRPENVLYDYLSKLPSNDKFWSHEVGGYNKQAFAKAKLTNTADRVKMKKWFNKEKEFWGTGCRKLFNRWKEDNQKPVDKLIEVLTEKIEYFNKH